MKKALFIAFGVAVIAIIALSQPSVRPIWSFGIGTDSIKSYFAVTADSSKVELFKVYPDGWTYCSNLMILGELSLAETNSDGLSTNITVQFFDKTIQRLTFDRGVLTKITYISGTRELEVKPEK